jgi:hypothetical protein
LEANPAVHYIFHAEQRHKRISLPSGLGNPVGIRRGIFKGRVVFAAKAQSLVNNFLCRIKFMLKIFVS